MVRKFKVALAAVFAFLCSLCMASQNVAQALPDGKGKAEFVNSCTACHKANTVTGVRKTPGEWKKTVAEMVSRGASGSKEDLDNILLYLDTFYSKDQPAPAAAASTATPSSPSSSNSDHVKQVIADNGCLACHRIEQQGGYTGPALNGVGSRHTAAEIRAAIVSPPPTLDASNKFVRLTTRDGTTHTGRILSQDDQQVQVIDASGVISIYAKPPLQQFTVIDANPMPPYEKTITGDDLDSLVRYLGSLPAIEENTHK